MHEYAICPSQNTCASVRQRNVPDLQGPSHGATTSPGATLRSHSSSSTCSTHFDANTGPTPGARTDAAVNTSEKPSSPKASKPQGDRPERLSMGGSLGWNRRWRIPAAIGGFYLLSIVCAILHYCFFVYLDDRILSPGIPLSAKTTTIPQAYVTTISLLLVTAFRAALVGSIGTAYTQLLWAKFRSQALKISLIEDLFQVQTNAFRFVNHGLYLKAPTLVAIAAFCWLVPIAAVYPPGALIVESRALTIKASHNVSTLNPKDLFEMQEGLLISTLLCSTNRTTNVLKPQTMLPLQNASLQEKCRFGYEDPKEKVQDLTRLAFIVGEIARLSHPGGENPSYNLTFWGTTLECETKNRTIERTVLQSEIPTGNESAPGMNNTWVVPNLMRAELRSIYDPDLRLENTTITYRTPRSITTFQYYPCLIGSVVNTTITNNFSQRGNIRLPDSGIRVFIPFTETICHPKIVRYYVDVSHKEGLQQVSYVIKDGGLIPQYTATFKRFNGSFEQWTQFSDALTIYADFASNLNKSYTTIIGRGFTYPSFPEKKTPHTLDNGTVVETCTLKSVHSMQETGALGHSDMWPLSVFVKRLSWKYQGWQQGPMFESQMAKELLENTTISALSLNERFDVVNGTELRNFNIYRFRHKLTLFLPYGLTLGLAIPIIVLGLIALYGPNHGVSAISGGFLQILMTTTGRTSIEKVIEKGSASLGGYENIPRELEEMEVKFGELVDGHGNECTDLLITDAQLSRHESSAGAARHAQDRGSHMESEKSQFNVCRAGFGTVKEIKSL